MKTPSTRDLRHAAARLVGIGAAALCLLVASSLAGCSKEAPPPPPPAAPAPPPPAQPPPPAAAPAAVTGVTLGKSVGADKKVSAPTETFDPKDTIHASVDTTGVGKGTSVKAKWTFTDAKGKTVSVHDEAQTLDLNGPATHEFHVSKKTPWPKGSYTFELFLNDLPAAKKAFTVK